MPIPTSGPARERLGVRDDADRALLERGVREGTVVIDQRLRRSNYFDGRLLLARDLTREQTYFLSRQADLGRAGGAGIVQGLMVTGEQTSIQITAGHGVTTSGELVLLSESLSIELTNIGEIERLDAAFGLSRIPREPARNRSGLFIVALRPVEFTANPVASYPTSVTGRRTVEDGDIVEAVVVSLVPYRDAGSDSDFGMRRARVAHELFVNRGTRGVPAGALPLAMIALDRGVVRWVDPFLVRREVGAEHGDVLGIGFAPRALREAHLLQYDRQLDEVIAQRTRQGPRFAASEHFLALPPAGRMPAACVDPRDFTQIFFPPEVDVELSIVPDDEVVALLEESLLLPPIDLTLGGEQQESTSVTILIPVPRESVRALRQTLANMTRPLRPAAPGLVAKRKPFESLSILRLPKPVGAIPAPGETDQDAAWSRALAQSQKLWYLRRRNLHYRADVVGVSVVAVGDEVRVERDFAVRLDDFGVKNLFNQVKRASSTQTQAEAIAMLASPKFMESKTLMESGLRDLLAAKGADPDTGKERIGRAEVLKVSERFSNKRLGEGLARLEQANPELKENAKIVKNLASAGVVAELDRVARTLAESEVKGFTDELAEAARRGASEQLVELVRKRSEEKSR
jgi:hypothetical protein